jgi:hypothetical protein
MTQLEYAKAGEATKARKIVAAALAKGWVVSVNDGEEWTVKKSSNKTEILDALCSTGMDTLRFRDAAGQPVGSMLLVWGNDPKGSELVSDSSTDGGSFDAFCEQFI